MARRPFNSWIVMLFALMMLPSALSGQSTNETDGGQRSYRRLPNYFGQIGISDRQRERIYSLQAEYNAQIEDLQARIEELKSLRDREVEAVLTEGQRKRVEERREEARLARDERRAAE